MIKPKITFCFSVIGYVLSLVKRVSFFFDRLCTYHNMYVKEEYFAW